MSFDAFDASLEMIRTIRGPLAEIRTCDANLANQIRSAANSVPLNLNEGRRRAGRDRKHHWRIAAGSADELVAALRVAEAWGYTETNKIEPSLKVLDRILAMTWKMTRG